MQERRLTLIRRRLRSVAVVAGFVAITAASCQSVKPPPPLPPLPDVEIDHADGFQPGSQDVYFLDGQDLRNPDAETPLDAPLFSVTGEPLPFTWGEYSGVEAKSVAVTVRSDEPHTYFFVELEGLVPDGVYSMFYQTLGPDSVNPFCPNALRELPVHTVYPFDRPDPSSFAADGAGAVQYLGRVEGAPLDAQQVALQVIFHSDGDTYHPLPNRGAFESQGESCVSSYGADAMRQLFILQKWIF